MSSWSYGAAVALAATAVSYWLDLLGARYRCKVALYYSALLVNSALMCPACVAAGPGRVENMLIGAKLMRPFSWLFGEWVAMPSVFFWSVLSCWQSAVVNLMVFFFLWGCCCQCCGSCCCCCCPCCDFLLLLLLLLLQLLLLLLLLMSPPPFLLSL